MDYQTVVATQFIPRCQTALNSIRDALVAAGLPAANVTVTMPDSTDLRFQLVAKKGSKTATLFIELTDATHAGGQPGTAIFTLWIDGNGTEITTTYTPGGAQKYVDDAGLLALLDKLALLEATIPEASVKTRAFLGL